MLSLVHRPQTAYHTSMFLLSTEQAYWCLNSLIMLELMLSVQLDCKSSFFLDLSMKCINIKVTPKALYIYQDGYHWIIWLFFKDLRILLTFTVCIFTIRESSYQSMSSLIHKISIVSCIFIWLQISDSTILLLS